MAEIKLKGNTFHTNGEISKTGDDLSNLMFTKNDLSDVALETYKGKKIVISLFPSVDTGTCALSVKNFNKKSSDLGNVNILNISADLPFAQKRFCGAEGIENVEVLSSFRTDSINKLGLEFTDGPLKGLSSRAVIIVDENLKVIYTQHVQETSEEPNYQEVFDFLTK